MNTKTRLIVIVVVVIGLIFTGTMIVAGSRPVTVKTSSAPPASKAIVFLNGAAGFVTPLAGGYLYFNKNTRGLNFSGPSGTQDVTAEYLITADPSPSKIYGGDSVQNTVVNIEATSTGAAVVTTTRGVFIASSSLAVKHLPEYLPSHLNFTASSYDASTNSLYLIAANSKAVYRYKLSQPSSAPVVVYTATSDINKVTASGGKMIIYFDDVPSTEPAVLTEYAKNHQLDPLVIDTATLKPKSALSGFQVATYVSLSASGKYVAIKRKLEGTITLKALASGKTYIVPSYDTGGAGWAGDTFYLARAKAVWSFNTMDAASSLLAVATIQTPITELRSEGQEVILSTNTNQSASLIPQTATNSKPIYQTLTTPSTPYAYADVPPEN